MTHGTLARPSWIGLASVLLLFCAPLFIGLRGWDLRSDEAIYSYEVDRILETGEWLTPRSIPTDGAFLEKPPLKPWLVAGAIRLGLLPFDERGMRAIDVTFAAIAFVYVYLLGWRLAGTVAGVVSVFLLFSFDPLIVEHGVRGNHMEAALLLAYCGGIYHFIRWVDGGAVRARRAQALAVAAYFTLGFMTKFVGMVFLPMVCAGALLLTRAPAARVRDGWRDWIVRLAVVVAACTPGVIYQTVLRGAAFWGEIFGSNVYTRFMGTLVAAHIQPWHHYITQTWREFGFAGMRIAMVAGLIALILRAWRSRNWAAQVLLLWLIVPLLVISAGTSKLFYYVYPFLPPLAMGGGLASAMLLDYLRGPTCRSLARRASAWEGAPRFASSARVRRTLSVIGGGAILLAVGTAVFGTLTIEIDGVRLFRNSSAVRPAIVGAVLWLVSGYGQRTMQPVAVVALMLLLPVSNYLPRVQRFGSIDHPLQSIRDCALMVQASGDSPPTGVFHADAEIHHSYFYYLRRLGPWTDLTTTRHDEMDRRLRVPGEQSPVLLSKAGYQQVVESAAALTNDAPDARDGARRHDVPPGISIGDAVFILLPGPYGVCVGPAVAGGGQELRTKT
jgi:4-amino-4-deoxy-L-arabinose transferase-like glycosyltransferase